MRVAVVGAGIGGLAVAAGLQRSGADVVVLERAEQPRPSGSGLSLWANGFAALDALSLGDAVRSIAGDAPTGLVAGQRRPDGRWLARIPAGAVAGLRVVHRGDLHRVLVEALSEGTLRTGCAVDAVSDAGDQVLLDGRSGRAPERFDLVVAADGIASSVRASWPGDPGRRYSGYTAWRGVTGSPVDLLGAAGETWGRGLRFGIAPLGDGRVYWFAVASMPAGTRLDDEHGEVVRRFGGWHDPIPALVAATPPDAVTRLDIDDLAAPLPTFRRGRCVLLGDAAHAMTPDLGQGANQALEDAATLVRLTEPLAAGPSPDAAALAGALADYDRLRRPRTQRIARRARMLGQVAQWRNPVAAGLRDTALRLTPEAATGRELAAVQAWLPPVSQR